MEGAMIQVQDPSKSQAGAAAGPAASLPRGVLRVRAPAQPAVPAPADTGDLWRRLPDSLYDAVCLTDPEGRVLDVNKRAEELFRRPRAELCQLTMPELVDGLTAAVLRTVRAQLETGHAAIVEGWCPRPGTDRLPVEAVVTRLSAAPPRLCFAVRGIAQRKVSETALRSEHQALEHAAWGLALTDLVGHIEYTNPALRALWGLTDTPPLEGKLISDFWGTNWMAAAWNCLRTGEPWRGTPTACGADGRPLRASVAPIWNKADEMIGLVVCVVGAGDETGTEGPGRAPGDAQRTPLPVDGFGGVFSALGVSDLVQLLDSAQMSGRLEFFAADAVVATLHFLEGRLACADCAGLTGEPAFLAALREPGDAFRFTPDVAPPRRDDVRRSLLALLIDACRKGQP
jgi:PAS domain S-box-containing protein